MYSKPAPEVEAGAVLGAMPEVEAGAMPEVKAGAIVEVVAGVVVRITFKAILWVANQGPLPGHNPEEG